jgi:hypothetical protein
MFSSKNDPLYKCRDEKKKEKNEWWEYAVPEKGFKQTNYEDMANDFRGSLESFVTVCRSWGIKPVLVTQPNRIDGDKPADKTIETQMAPLFEFGIDYKTYCSFYKGFNEQIRSVALEMSVPLIDLDNEIPKENIYIWDSIHLTQKGAKISGMAIAKRLQDVISK